MHAASQSSVRKPSLLGQRLVALGLVDATELRRMLNLQSRLPQNEPVRRLGSLLVQSGRISMRQLADALGEQRQLMPSSGVANQVPAPLARLFPAELLREIGAAPLCLIGKTLAVAMIDGNDEHGLARLQALTVHTIRPMQAPQLQVHRLLQSLPSTAGPATRAAVKSAQSPLATAKSPQSPLRPVPPQPPTSRKPKAGSAGILLFALVLLAGLLSMAVRYKLHHPAAATAQSP